MSGRTSLQMMCQLTDLLLYGSLHDLRRAGPAAGVFRDPVDTFSPIYSLLSVGSERFIAGGGRHSIIKMFDLRMPGGKLYHATDVDPCSLPKNDLLKQKSSDQWLSCCGYHYEAKKNRRDWNVFLGVSSRRLGGNRESPVYCLSRPSQCSPSLFAGIESTIAQIDMVSIMDSHPDPIYGDVQNTRPSGSSRLDRSQDYVKRKWNPSGDIASLPMYEHDEGPVNLLQQQEVGRLRGNIAGFDERWTFHQSLR